MITIVQVTKDRAPDQGRSGRGGENWPEAGGIFKIEPTSLPDRLHMGCERMG